MRKRLATEEIERYKLYLLEMGLPKRLAEPTYLRNYMNKYRNLLNDKLRGQLIDWVVHLLKSLDKMGERSSQQQDVKVGQRCARTMTKGVVNLLKVPWGSANPSEAVDNTSDPMTELEKRIQSVLRDYDLSPKVIDRKTYNEFFSEPKDHPTIYEQIPSICLFPFYKVEGNRPCWSIFQFGTQQKLGLVLNEATAYSLLKESHNPGPVTDVHVDGLLDKLLEGLHSSQANKGKYERNFLLDFGKGYAATDILEVMLAKKLNPVDFRQEELLVGLADALEDPIKPSNNPVVPNERKEDVAKLLDARWGTRLALISDPGEPTFIYLENHYKPELVIYKFNHYINVEVGIGFSLGMIRWFVKDPNVVRELADQIYNFLIGEAKSKGWRDAIESRGVNILEGHVRDNYYHDPSVFVDPKPTGSRAANESKGKLRRFTNGVFLEEFRDAIVEAFEPKEFDMFLYFKFNITRSNIAKDDKFPMVVSEVLRNAERESYMAGLIAKVAEERSGNERVKQVCLRYAKLLMTEVKRFPDQERILNDYECFKLAPPLSVQRAGKELFKRPLSMTDKGLQEIFESDRLDVALWRRQYLQQEGRICRVELNRGQKGGTGFLVGPDAVLTNYHVLAPLIAGQLRPSDVHFRFDAKVLLNESKLEGVLVSAHPTDWRIYDSRTTQAELENHPDAEQPTADQLDYALVRLERAIGREPIDPGVGDSPLRGWVKVPTADPAITIGMVMMIMSMQQPNEGSLKLALDKNAVCSINDNRTRVSYATKTAAGSAGSPCFDINWGLIALHHHNDPKFGQGIPIGRIREQLRNHGQEGALGDESASLNKGE